jgi:hypothetical protein
LGDDVRCEEKVITQVLERQRTELGWESPVESATFYDRNPGSHKARRKKNGNGVDEAGFDKCAVNLTSALDEKRLHFAGGEQS